MPSDQRGLGNSVMFLGTAGASAATAPLVSWIVARLGWQASFYVTAIPPLLLALGWVLFARDDPHDIRRAAEMAEPKNARLSARELGFLLSRRNALLLVVSYVSEGYVLFIFVFWMYIYLVERRGFSLLTAGWVAAIPWLAALLLTPLGGYVCDRVGRSRGRAAGSRTVIVVGYSASGALLYVAASAGARSISVAALCLSIASLMAAEAGFWSYAAHLGREHVGLLSGIMNTAGILGGVASTSLVPIVVRQFGWLPALASGTVMALLCSGAWFFIREP
jgi:ACS family glucarate transporter-like MFS transporter